MVIPPPIENDGEGKSHASHCWGGPPLKVTVIGSELTSESITSSIGIVSSFGRGSGSTASILRTTMVSVVPSAGFRGTPRK